MTRPAPASARLDGRRSAGLARVDGCSSRCPPSPEPISTTCSSAAPGQRRRPMSPPDGADAVRRIIEMSEEVKPEPSAAEQWPVMDSAAYYGLAGDVVHTIEPHTEADPVALLVQFLTAVGNVLWRGPHYRVEGDRHGTNLFGVLVGETAKGRKGTSWGRARQIMEIADPEWTRDRIHSGLSSGEGVIWAVRDPIRGTTRSGKGSNRETVEEITDPGVTDKRLMILEPEFA